MKPSVNIKSYTSKADYLNRKKGFSGAPRLAKKLLSKQSEASSVELSELAKSQASQETKSIRDKMENKAKEGLLAAEKVSKEIGSGLKKAWKSPPVSPLVDIVNLKDVKKKNQVDEAKKVKDIKADDQKVDTPGIFFITGLSLNPFATDEFGLTGMANNIPKAEVFNWNQSEKILQEISKRPHVQPVLLIGHGLGGDTAVELSNTLNSVEHGFRRVDLLVTLDSIGLNNDVIPQNVKENVNFVPDEGGLLNDGPNIARKYDATKVSNELRSESHSELDESPEVQFKIYEKINQVLKSAVLDRQLFYKLNKSRILENVSE